MNYDNKTIKAREHFTHWSDKYKKLSPCKEAMDYMQSMNSEEEAYNLCKKGQWLHWLRSKVLYAAAYAAYAAAYAAYVADAAVYVAAAAYAADAAAYVADADAAADAAADAKEADLIRKHYPTIESWLGETKRMRRD